ncbi:hypothetical protein EDD18DRAFT_327113 [Armillaria luteobubalina]|uniref:NAD(P)-binding protein n=1 Tax=Armillaria luteobubalina TaxID=153913 RepID=A0AA39QLK8_9AGAR|nr:hypothetical protein EDD18DRAFT_327113 [Armillaria luteobubalina]
MLSTETDLVAVGDDELLRYAERVKDKVVLITEASKGIGKETAIRFGFYGAKVVVGDQDTSGAQAIAHEIVTTGGAAISASCNATVWDDVVALFDLAVKTYGGLDIVVANTGVTEVGQFTHVSLDSNGKPMQPDLTTVEVNLVGILHVVHLAQYYLARKRQPNDLKALVMLGSIGKQLYDSNQLSRIYITYTASWHCLPQAPLYSASGCAVLGTMRTLYPDLEHKDIRTAVISPSFSVSDNDSFVEVSLKGLALSPIARVADSIFYAATNPEKETNGRAWLIRDDGPLYMIPREDLNEGVFRTYNKRFNALISAIDAVSRFSRNPGEYLMRPSLLIIALGFFGSYAYSVL